MSFFDNLFGNRPGYKLPEIPKRLIELPTNNEAQDMSKDAIYMVGMNEDGMTQLRVGYPTSITLTLNAAGVAQLIKQLAVNIDEEYSVKVSRIEYEDE